MSLPRVTHDMLTTLSVKLKCAKIVFYLLLHPHIAIHSSLDGSPSDIAVVVAPLLVILFTMVTGIILFVVWKKVICDL